MKPYLAEALQKAYTKSIQLVLKETNLAEEKIPAAFPYDLHQVLSNAFYPGSSSDLID
ncbi:MAG: DUF29 family protein [Cyanobacteria bacterium P01_H01_bin.105]